MEVDRIVSVKFLKPALTEWKAAIAFLSKMDGSLRFFVGYDRLQDVMIGNNYPISLMYECIDSLGGASMFSAFDANTVYL